MATYAIGDVHGCFETLGALLERIGFSGPGDRLWLVGDLVNRGPRSVDVLRWAIDQGDRVTAVMGNHDLHALAVADGLRPTKPRDAFSELLAAPDRNDLLAWLRQRPLVVRDDPWWMVHAGVSPGWSPESTERLARELEDALDGPGARDLVQAVYDGPVDTPWSESLPPGERRRWALRVMTRLRTCRTDTTPCDGFAGPPEDAPAGCRPWFEQLSGAWSGLRIVFGHWAALGVRLTDTACGLDSGCVYGGALTALRLDDGKVFQHPVVDDK